MNLAEIRARVRQDLHDEDANNYRWTDEELNRHIQHAVRELSIAVPVEAKVTLYTTTDSRELSISSLSDLVAIEAVEYPVGKYPPQYVQFSLWGDTLTLLTDTTPGEGEEADIYYGKLHTLDESSSTIPAPLEDVVAIGAAGYAAVEWATFATNRVNLGGSSTWKSYLTWGQDRLASFLRALAKHSRKNRVRARRLYRAYQPGASQTTDWGP
jgi:hypothetical protein